MERTQRAIGGTVPNLEMYSLCSLHYCIILYGGGVAKLNGYPLLHSEKNPNI